ncbi:MAG: hypothetical protein WCO02_07470 [Bacteroidota bacterium]
MESKTNTRHKFKPGEGGRPKGSPNKITAEQKERIEWVLELLDETLEDSIRKLKPKDQVDLWMNLQEYIRPKLQRVNVDLGPAEDKLTKITFEVIQSSMLTDGTVKPLSLGKDHQGIDRIPEKL